VPGCNEQHVFPERPTDRGAPSGREICFSGPPADEIDGNGKNNDDVPGISSGRKASDRVAAGLFPYSM
jgi:hypothetical protein